MSEDLPLQIVLERIDAWYAEHVPAIHATLRPGASDSELNALEEHTGLTLPEAFRTLYRWHDGQDWSVGGMFNLLFMPLEHVQISLDNWRDIKREMPEINHNVESHSYPLEAIRHLYCSADWLGFLKDGGGNFVGLDFGPGPNGTPGQVVTFGRDELYKYVLAPSSDTFLREYWARLEAGRVTVVSLPGYEGEMWNVQLHDDAGRHKEGYFVLAELFPNFGAAPGILDEHPSIA